MSKLLRSAGLQATNTDVVADLVPPITDIILRQAVMSIAAVGGPRPEGSVGATAFQFIVTRTGNTDIAASVDWRVPVGTGVAADAADFIGGILPSGTVSFAVGETSKTITVLVAADNRIEANETFSVQLATRDAAVAIEQGTASATVLNDDSYSDLRIFAGGTTQAGAVVVHQEGDAGQVAYQFDVRRSGDVNRTTTVNWQVAPSGGTPASTNDFVGGVLPSGSVFFAAGETVKTITVMMAGDVRVEANETFDVVISTPNNDATVMKAAATGVIINDDQVSQLYVRPADPAQGNEFVVLSEGDTNTTPFRFEIVRAGDVDRVSVVNWKATPSGASPASGADFLSGTLPSGTVAFGVGETSKIITVRVVGDTHVEATETFDFSVSTFSPDTVVMDGTATGVIMNDDNLSELYIFSGESADFSHFNVKNEGNTGTTQYTFRVDRAMDTGRVTTVDWHVTPSAGSTVSSSDFVGGVMPSGTVTFGVGETQKFITVNVVGEKTVEQNEPFDVVLSNPSADSVVMTSTATGVILNDDQVSQLYVRPADPAQGTEFVILSEGNAGTQPFQFEIVRTNDTGRVTVANWKVTPSGSTSANGADFLGGTMPSGSVVFGVGETSKVITVQVAGDTHVEGNETFDFTVSTTSPDSVVMDGTATGVIMNDDNLSELYIFSGESAGYSHTIVKNEGNTGTTPYTFRVDRVMDTGRVTTVDWYVAKSPGSTVGLSDFAGGVLPSGTVTFGVGETQKFITVNVAGEKSVEQSEAFDVILSNPSADSVVKTAAATGVIVNDDTPSTLAIIPAEPAALNYFITQAEGNAGATQFTYAINRGGDLGRVTVANWQVNPSGINPANAADFIGGLPSGSVTFGVGESTKLIAVNVRGDGVAEATESFQVALSTSGSDAVVTQATAGGIIVNDDQPGVVSISAQAPHRFEGNAGSTPFTFTVARTGDTTTQASVQWKVSGAAVNGANAADFVGNVLPSGTVTFAAGQASQIVTVNVNGDTQYEADETLFVTLSNASPSLVIGTGSAAATIVNDDSARVAASVVSSDLNSTTMSFIGGSDPAEPSATDTRASEDTSPTAETFGKPTIADLTADLARFFMTDIPEPSVLAGLGAWTSPENLANFLLTHDLPI